MKHQHSRRADLPFHWPDPPFHVVLVSPQIPPNTGNIARTCAATRSRLHLVDPLGFTLTDARLKRAGLDYWDSIRPERHADFEGFLEATGSPRCWFFSTGGARSCFDVAYRPGDALVFGSETDGLPDALLAAHPGQVVGIPLDPVHVRSLNLSSAAAIALYEALRQQQSAAH